MALAAMFWRIAAVAWTILVIWGSLTPSPPAPPSALAYDKLQHFSAYAFLALWWWPLLRGPAWKSTGLLALAGLGGVLECLQSLETARQPELLDAFANLCGVALGAALAMVLRYWWRYWGRDLVAGT